MASMRLLSPGRAWKTSNKYLLSPEERYEYSSSLHFQKVIMELGKAEGWASEKQDWMTGKMGNIGVFSAERKRLRRDGTIL